MIRSVKACFNKDGRYFENKLGSEYNFTQATGPYEYLLGALSGCFFLTLNSFERKSDWKSLEFDVVGNKDDNNIPSYLKETTITITARGVEDRSEFEHLVEGAKKECSIYNTIGKVSSMSVIIKYED